MPKNGQKERRNMIPNHSDELPEELTLATEEVIEQGKREGKFIPKHIWDILRKRKEQGTFKGEIQTFIPKTIVNLTSGKHYYIVDDIRQRRIRCTTCEIGHGGVLEAHMLTRYKIEDGILYLDNKPINQTP